MTKCEGVKEEPSFNPDAAVSFPSLVCKRGCVVSAELVPDWLAHGVAAGGVEGSRQDEEEGPWWPAASLWIGSGLTSTSKMDLRLGPAWDTGGPDPKATGREASAEAGAAPEKKTYYLKKQ